MNEQHKTQSTGEWETPQLILLGRGQPEEWVLAKCIDAIPGGPGEPDTYLENPLGS